MARKNPDGSFELYPYEKLIGLIDRETDLRSALAELEEAGFDDERVYYFHGEKGLRILDLDGDEHGLLTMIVRALQKSISREAEEGMKAVKESMRRGSFGDRPCGNGRNEGQCARYIQASRSLQHPLFPHAERGAILGVCIPAGGAELEYSGTIPCSRKHHFPPL